MQLSCSVSGLAACKTELTRLQLPGSGGGLELVVVLQCCSAAAAAVCSLGLSCYNYTLGGAASGYQWLLVAGAGDNEDNIASDGGHQP